MSDGPVINDLQGAAINFSASGDTAIIAGAAGKITNIMALYIIVGGATNITIKDGSTALTGPLPLLANGSFVLEYRSRPHFANAAANTAININSSAAVQVSGRAEYIQVSG